MAEGDQKGDFSVKLGRARVLLGLVTIWQLCRSQSRQYVHPDPAVPSLGAQPASAWHSSNPNKVSVFVVCGSVLFLQCHRGQHTLTDWKGEWRCTPCASKLEAGALGFQLHRHTESIPTIPISSGAIGTSYWNMTVVP